ncbi:coiled-coil domain-containing protein 39-like isoform X2 [Ischnura elegans]|uniref:coiled-coil domain-containing protein 39-like isoform X2 n=1 Tax=Ischnura elegans TaxID=197161 RepID=UPI001ED898B9|nr:coiled-coil domain-containing protein 39-like isoform X2 [Ischnura elegans]
MNKVDEILKVIGWTDGYHVPVLNEENEKLSKKVEGMLKDKAAFILKTEDLTNRVNAIEKHVKDIKEFRQHVQALINSFRKCADSEDHMIKIALRDGEKMKQDMHKFLRLHTDACHQNNGLECEVRQLQQSIEDLKREAQFDRETLDLWEEEIFRKEKENQVIDCYFHEDNLKVKEQNRQLERLQLEVTGKQREMDKLNCDVQSLELALENMCTLFRKMHTNRQYLIEQWESCVAYMAKRDEDISIARHEVNGLQGAELQCRETRVEEERFLQSLQRDNRQAEWQSQTLKREGAVLEGHRDRAMHQVNQLKTNISNARSTLACLEKHAAEKRCTLRHLTKESAQLEARVSQARDALAALERRRALVQSEHTSARERAATLEGLLQAEEVHLNAVSTELRIVQESIFRNESMVQGLKGDETSLLVVLKGAEGTLKALANKRHALVQEHMHKSQMEYHLDFLIQKLETRIARMTGKESLEKQEELKKKLETLMAVVAEKSADKRLLVSQKSKLDDEERYLRTALDTQAQELQRLASAKAEEVVATKQMAKGLGEQRAAHQRLLLDEGILRMRVGAAESALTSHGRQLLSLEQEALELQTAIKERRLELGMEREVLEVRKRAAAEEVSMLGNEIRHMQAKIGQLQKRYEIETASFAYEDEEVDHDPMSLIRFNLKVAQCKQELQEEGDRLEQRVRNAEAEIGALEATLRLVSGANDALKGGGASEDHDAGGDAERCSLEEKVREALRLRRTKNLSLVEHQNEVADRTAALAELDSQIGEMSRALKEEAVLASGLQSEMQEQALKQGRALQQVRRLQADVRKVAAGDAAADPTFDERDIYARQLSAATKRALHLLACLCSTHEEAADDALVPRVQQLLADRGLTTGVSPSLPAPSPTSPPTRLSRPTNTTPSPTAATLFTIDGSLLTQASPQGGDRGSQHQASCNRASRRAPSKRH